MSINEERVLKHIGNTSSTKPNNTSAYRQHPEHAVNGDTVRSTGKDTTDNNHGGREDDGEFPTQIIASQANGDLTKDFADKKSIGNSGADIGSILDRIFSFQEDLETSETIFFLRT